MLPLSLEGDHDLAIVRNSGLPGNRQFGFVNNSFNKLHTTIKKPSNESTGKDQIKIQHLLELSGFQDREAMTNDR